jgi:N-acetylglucosaminyldiphosphoundecaprenol N-acetyl-beta-D-mannosaminyltransferase
MRDRLQREVHCLLGLPFDAVDMDTAVNHVRKAATERERLFMSTPNLNFVIASRKDLAFRQSIINSDLSVADGMPLIWVARLLGIPIPQRIAGSSMFEQLKQGAVRKLRVYLYGGKAGVAAAASTRLNSEESSLVCSGFEYPGLGSTEELSNDQAIARINASGADYLVVALGAKKGQAWIEHNRERITVPVISHLGAVINFAAGTVARAPRWLQKAGLEWLWRIKEEPALWRRYVSDGMAFMRLLITEVVPLAWHLRVHKPKSPIASTVERADAPGETVLRLRGPWVRQNLTVLRDYLSTADCVGRHLRIDLKDVPYVDSSFLGLLLVLSGTQKARSCRMVLSNVTEKVRKIFHYSGCDFLLAGVWGREATAQPDTLFERQEAPVRG